MKLLTTSAVVALLGAAPAYANSSCGTEPGPVPAYTLPVTGQQIIAQPIWSSGIGDDGVIVQNNQKACGETAAYIYTGANPGSDIQAWIKLYPTVVSPGVAFVKCAASLAVTSDAYYKGYPATYWPYEFRVDCNNDQYSDGVNMYVLVEAWNPYGVTLNPYTTYTISVLASPNSAGN